VKSINLKVTLLYFVSLISLATIAYLVYPNIAFLITAFISFIFISFTHINILNEIKELNKNRKKEETQNNESKNEIDDFILDEILLVTENSVNNIFGKRIRLESKNKKYLQIAKNINITLENFQYTIDNILGYLDAYQKNDFTKSLANNATEEMRPLVEGINNLNIKISRMLLSSL
jgi:methyl-accepting chemotaxis protein